MVVRNLTWLLVLALLLPRSAHADDAAALRRLAEGEAQREAGENTRAWQSWQLALGLADSNFLSIEALTRMAGISRPASREQANSLGLLMAYFQATPPRWLSDRARKTVSDTIAARVATGAYPEQRPDLGVRSVNFDEVRTALDFHGQRYFWMAHLPTVPPPVREYRINEEIVQFDDDRLPEERVALSGGRWALVDPRHAGPTVPAAAKQDWRFDRVLVGYTYEPFLTYLNELGRETVSPTRPWFEGMHAIWQLRFRLFYPSAAVGGGEYDELAEHLMDALLRAQWLAVEGLGRDVQDANWRDQVIDVWLTPSVAEEAMHAGGERWLNNLYFYQADTRRGASEWVREAFHEYSHVMMPRIGRFTAAQQYELWLDGPIGERLLLARLADALEPVEIGELSPWMRELKRSRFFTEYAEQYWQPPLEVFLSTGPTGPERVAVDDRGAAWLIGFLLWLDEAHSPAFIGDFYRRLSPNSQYESTALLAAYQARVKEQEALALNAARPFRQLRGSPVRAVDGRVLLASTQQLEYLVWLDENRWDLRFLTSHPAAVTVSFAAGAERLLETGTTEESAPAMSFSTESGWYRIRVSGFGDEPAPLERLVLRAKRSR